MINQSVVFVPIVVLKTEVTKAEVMTKDDSSPDGWRIGIHFGRDSIEISHTRKEMPLGTPPLSLSLFLPSSFFLLHACKQERVEEED